MSFGETAKHHRDAPLDDAVEAVPEVAEMGRPGPGDRVRKGTDYGGAKAFQGMMAWPQSNPVTPAQVFGFSAKASVLLGAAVLLWKKLWPKLKDVVPLLKKAAPALKAAVSLYVVSLIWKPFAKIKDFVFRPRQSTAARSRETARKSAAAVATLNGQPRPACLPEAVEVSTVASAEPPRIKPQHGHHQQTSESKRRSNGVMIPNSRVSPFPTAPRVTPGGGGTASHTVLKLAVCAALLGGAAFLRRESPLPHADDEGRVIDC